MSCATAQQRAILRERVKKIIESLNRKEGRLLLEIEEQTGAVIYWPYRFAEMMLSTHLRFSERWQLTLFLLGNRTPPRKIAEWYVARKMLKDKAARDQVIDLIKQHMTGKLEENGRSTWVMNATVDKPLFIRKHAWDSVGDPAEDKNQVIATPTFAFDWEHQWMWTDAIDILRNNSIDSSGKEFAQEPKRMKVDLVKAFDK